MKKLINFLLVLVIISTILLTVVSSFAFVYLYKKAGINIDKELLSLPSENTQTIVYYYQDGDPSKPKVLTENLSCSESKYSYVPISRVPQKMIDAFISVEDKRFYSHHGVDFIRSAKAVANYILRKSSSFGASTITQQVIKNLTGKSERTPKRKINEVFLALNFEKNHSKDEILEIYFNIINLSNGCMGVGAAADFYFSKSPNELSLCEIAAIAAITNNPSLYDPIKCPQNTVGRRNVVLKCMYDQGYISESEYNYSKVQPLELNVNKKSYQSNLSWFEETLISDLVRDFTRLGYTKQYAYNTIFNGGLRIYTTVNPDIQNILESYYRDLDTYLSVSNVPSPQSSMIIMDPYNGDILGIAGAIGKKQGNLIQNYATDTKRSPGSTIKPLSVYAPLIEKGEINWATIVNDSPISNIQGKDWPQNANRKYEGNINICDAIANSTNTVSVKMLYKLGAKNSLSFLKNRLHIDSLISPTKDSSGDENPVSLALGQTLNGISLRELTAGYSIFAQGNMSTARSYYKVTDANGNLIFDNRKNQEEVISEQSASIMTKLLEQVVISGTASGGQITLLKNVDVAGKTGTTQNNCDKLFVGYTPSLLAGVWCGYDYPQPLSGALGNPSVRIWNDILTQIYRLNSYKDAPKQFHCSEKVQMLTYNSQTGQMPVVGDSTDILRNGWFLQNNFE